MRTAVLVVAALAAASVGSGGTAFTPDDHARLGRGETVWRLVPVPGEAYREGLAARVLPRPPERVARAVGDLGHWAEWVPFLASAAPEPEPGGVEPPAWRLRFDLPLPLRDRHYAARAVGATAGEGDERRWEVTWTSVPGSGNVAWAEGSFSVSPYGAGKSLVVFRTATDTGDRTPRFLLDRALRQSLPWVLDGLTQQVNRCRYTEPRPRGCTEEPPTTP